MIKLSTIGCLLTVALLCFHTDDFNQAEKIFGQLESLNWASLRLPETVRHHFANVCAYFLTKIRSDLLTESTDGDCIEQSASITKTSIEVHDHNHGEQDHDHDHNHDQDHDPAGHGQPVGKTSFFPAELERILMDESPELEDPWSRLQALLDLHKRVLAEAAPTHNVAGPRICSGWVCSLHAL